jgi:hypothetical protein
METSPIEIFSKWFDEELNLTKVRILAAIDSFSELSKAAARWQQLCRPRNSLNIDDLKII